MTIELLLSIFSTLQIVDSIDVIAMINIVEILTIALSTIDTIIIIVDSQKINATYVTKKIVNRISIQKTNNEVQKKIEKNIEIFVTIKTNTVHF